ncbi:WPP domain-interacting tail-anchored protein 2-like isoform X1 [Helianthus annuus]|uniref:WPP domain-interacting tail-anchored protein 2-like isoform X1 n=1 Tax=Helianthus annuus TaxID=4232 RepID=UPI001652ECD7|nr:WPP domain-interacting tail-anchored protein 2-like isoform X1 [Helianthus annuus]XP_035840904.1 WPP domain-interacting tail-anchored protein 2-like isoform X1 [Helianthus annuus]
MESVSTCNNNVINPELVRFHEGITSDSKDIGEIGVSMEILTKVDLELAYASEKLLNLENLLLYVLSWENDFEAMSADDVSEEFVAKSLQIDLLFSFLDSEVKELDGSMDSIRVDLVDAHQRLSSCRHLGELCSVVEGKLHDSEDSLKKSQEHVLEMKIKLAKLRMTSLAFNHNEFLTEDFQVSNMEVKPRLQTVNKVHVLRMLEKSLSRELDLEKKLTESKQDEEDLRLKLRLTEQVAFIMEEAAEVVWGRFLEAENTSVVLMGVSRDLIAQHKLVQFNLNGFNQRENEFRSKLENCIKLLNSKDASIEKLNSRITQLVADNLEVSVLREKVKSLEEKVNESESNLKKANESNELFQDRLREMENVIESLKDDVYTAEDRAETAELKVAELTDSNNELSEELMFLKSSHESSSKKMTLLEKQSRELEIQARNAKASSEAGQEQQNMLYTAIWDMETLIDELKQKVSTAEMKAKNAEEQCLSLTDNNSELTKEVEFLRAEVESLETSLSNANREKMASTKDISAKTKLIMDTVLQLAKERERITKQLHTQSEEKRILMETLKKFNMDVYTNTHPKGGIQEKNTTFSGQDATLNEKSAAEFSKQDEEIQALNDASIHDPEPESSITDSDPNMDDAELEEPQSRSKRMLVFRAIFVLTISVLAAFFINCKPDSFDANVG